MASNDVAVRPRRSAFAAAFLSFVFPGLGHAYLRRWRRALAWAVLPILGIVLGGGLLMSPDRSDYISALADPDVLFGVLAFITFDFFYRLLAVLDAYRLAQDPRVGSAGSRMLSMAGLVALIFVAFASHVVLAQPVLLVTDTIGAITDNAGDDTEIADLDALAADNPDFQINFDELEQTATAEPSLSPGPSIQPTVPDELPTIPDELPTVPDEVPTVSDEAPTVPDELPPDVEATTDEVTTTPAKEWTGKERLNILLIGADGGRQGGYSYLTDTMIVVSIDPTTGRTAFISLPRDTANIPLPRNWGAYRAFGGKYNNKINTLYTVARGRPDLFPGNDKQRGYNALMGALGSLYGLDINYYVAVDLSSFRSVVNTLGGVVIDVQNPVAEDGYPTDDGRGKVKLYIPPGVTKMNGQQSLAFARSRHGSSDFDRSARQQTVITSVRNQTDLESLLQPGVIDKLAKQVRKDVKTNIPPKLWPRLANLAKDIDLDRRENLVLSSDRGFSSVCYPCGDSGLWMLKANAGKMKDAAKNVFSNSRKQARLINTIEEEGAVVYVLNGEGGTNTKAVNIAEHLAARGFDAQVPPVDDGKADTAEQKATLITVYNGAADVMPESVLRIKRSFKDKNAELVEVDDPDQDADIVVTVGAKTKELKA